ncbi:MAG: hypothetical protein HQL63_01535 [Magnetococcales bacterium]|nr:hypothetical protein [Magnetococcales bacterium]MBF0323386.1 hypothetical protein [Magnetococcales bacterium]
MQHRHLNHQTFTLAAIDDVIARGGRNDWAVLRRAALADPSLLEKTWGICRVQVADPYAQRYHFWKLYAEHHIFDRITGMDQPLD